MPELPEVETVRRGLETAIVGRIITDAEIRRSDLRWPLPERMKQRIENAGVNGIGRSAKYLLVRLSTSETLLVHLGMSGRISVLPPSATSLEAEPGRHDHVLLRMDDGTSIVYNDPRRFGAMDLFPTSAEASHKLLRDIGPEPLGDGFTDIYLRKIFEKKNSAVKSVLLNQKVVAGLGNIYACEALWRAKVSPLRNAKDLERGEAAEIVECVKDVLVEAIDAGGSSLRDYRTVGGELGYFQHRFQVYGRAGEPCRRQGCDGKIQNMRQSGRSTYFCQDCQD